MEIDPRIISKEIFKTEKNVLFWKANQTFNHLYSLKHIQKLTLTVSKTVSCKYGHIEPFKTFFNYHLQWAIGFPYSRNFQRHKRIKIPHFWTQVNLTNISLFNWTLLILSVAIRSLDTIPLSTNGIDANITRSSSISMNLKLAFFIFDTSLNNCLIT